MPPKTSDGIKVLAVLPLDNLSAESDQDYFAAGMTEALIAELSQLGAFKVISRTSVMQYKDTTKTIPEIASELGVDAVVEIYLVPFWPTPECQIELMLSSAS